MIGLYIQALILTCPTLFLGVLHIGGSLSSILVMAYGHSCHSPLIILVTLFCFMQNLQIPFLIRVCKDQSVHCSFFLLSSPNNAKVLQDQLPIQEERLSGFSLGVYVTAALIHEYIMPRQRAQQEIALA